MKMDTEELKAELRRTDYVAAKFADALVASPVEEWESVRLRFVERYAGLLEHRQECRDGINGGGQDGKA